MLPDILVVADKEEVGGLDKSAAMKLCRTLNLAVDREGAVAARSLENPE